VLRLLTYAAIALAITVSLASASAADRKVISKEKKLEDINKKLRQTKKNINVTKKEETDILGLLDTYNRELSAYRVRLTAINDSIMTLQTDIREADSSVTRLARERATLKDRLAKRLRAMYKMRGGWALNAAFSGSTSEEAARRIRMMSYIMDSDKALMASAERNLKDLNDEKRRLETLNASFKKSRDALTYEKRNMEKSLTSKKGLLSDVRKKKDSYARLERQLEGAKAELVELIKELSEGSVIEAEEHESAFSSMKGRLIMPVAGDVVSAYGKVTHPKFNTATFNNGVVIEAPFGSDVKAVYDAKVAYVGWLRGYGQVIILDHGGGYYTLYAYLSEALKKRGNEVIAGDVIAKVGDSGSSETVGLYFEVRQKGVPRDPAAWLAVR